MEIRKMCIFLIAWSISDREEKPPPPPPFLRYFSGKGSTGKPVRLALDYTCSPDVTNPCFSFPKETKAEGELFLVPQKWHCSHNTIHHKRCVYNVALTPSVPPIHHTQNAAVIY